MIVLTFVGLDQFVVGHYSKEHTLDLSNLFECDEDEIDFAAPGSMVFHNGVEQTSWDLFITVEAPAKYAQFEEKVAKYLLSTANAFAIHVHVRFVYFEEASSYRAINPEYPRFISESNIVKEEEFEEEFDPEGPDPRDRADLDMDNEEELFLGNAFEGFEEKIEAKRKEKEAEHDHGHCGCDHKH